MPLGRILIYARNIEETSRLYEKHFGFKATRLPDDKIVELVAQDGGANIMLHQSAKGLRSGQSIVRLIFDVEDVESFAASAPKMDSNLRRFTKRMGICLPMQKTHVKIPFPFPVELLEKAVEAFVAKADKIREFRDI